MRQDLNKLPSDLPRPIDDGKADHLKGMEIPQLSLESTEGHPIDLQQAFRKPTVLFIYPRAGIPIEPNQNPELWDTVPGARGCTPQSCGFRELTDRLNLPTFEFEGERLIKRMAFFIENSKIEKVFYPVFPPDKNAEEVLSWLKGR